MAKRTSQKDAADWLLTLGESSRLDDGDFEQFEHWLEADDNAHEFADRAQTWSQLEKVGADIDVDALLASAPANSQGDAESDRASLSNGGKTAGASASVVPLGGRDSIHSEENHSKENKPSAFARFSKVVMASAAAALIAVGVLLLPKSQEIATQHFATVVGEQAVHILGDGTQVQLNTRTAASFDQNEDYRYLSLHKGEAMFTVAKDADRPFFIQANDALIRVVGTQFNVQLHDNKAVVSVLEGEVAVSSQTFSRQRLRVDSSAERLRAGDQWTLALAGSSHHGRSFLRKAKLDHVRSWIDQKMIFDNDSLEEIVSQFNRYHAVPLVLESGDLADLKMTGVFHIHDVDALLATLKVAEGLDFRFKQSPDRRIIYRPSK